MPVQNPDPAGNQKLDIINLASIPECGETDASQSCQSDTAIDIEDIAGLISMPEST